MLFNSIEYIFFFLPASVGIYFFLNRLTFFGPAKLYLVLCCLFFYGWWDLRFVPLLLASLLFNFAFGSALTRSVAAAPFRRPLLALGIAVNLGLLGVFKYLNFFIDSLNVVSGSGIGFIAVALPLGISFFTFQQITYLVDSYRGKAKEYDILNYALFVTFFPQLIAGPIVHHKEMMPQFAARLNAAIDFENVSRGAFVFVIGLFKKIILADTFGMWADQGFAGASTLNFIEAWVASLSYTFQLYFDFSGYSDMAIGAALMFNIRLPYNFFSPYKSLSIGEFWRRWHMTLSRFLRDYVYIPLGGNARGSVITYRNVLITFLLGGLWHGAGWTFILWGALHGLALVIQRTWNAMGFRLPVPLAWLVTFLFLNVTWVVFRAPDWSTAMHMLKAMAGYNSVVLPNYVEGPLSFLGTAGVEFSVYWFEAIDWTSARFAFVLLPACLMLVLKAPNSMELLDGFAPTRRRGVYLAVLFSTALVYVNREAKFLYFQF